MDRRLYLEMRDTRDEIEKYLNQRNREFRGLKSRLGGISSIVDVDNVQILSTLPEIQSKMVEISSDYLRAKKAFDTIKTIILESTSSPDIAAEAYKLFKDQVVKEGILSPESKDVAKLKKAIAC